MKTENIDLIKLLTEVFPSWLQEIPELPDHFQECVLEPHEYLSLQRGDIYLVSGGSFGKYDRKEPIRYILPGELIIGPLKRNHTVFKSLNGSRAYLLDRPTLYRISQQYPHTLELYDELLQKQLEAMEFRQHILSLPKGERLEYFRSKYAPVLPIISRKELASFLQISVELLRKIF